MWKVAKEARLGNLETPPSVRKLQTALHAKAKAEPEYRFYLLYDKVYRADILSFAYARCKANAHPLTGARISVRSRLIWARYSRVSSRLPLFAEAWQAVTHWAIASFRGDAATASL
jgi:hypothetical protein